MRLRLFVRRCSKARDRLLQIANLFQGDAKVVTCLGIVGPKFERAPKLFNGNQLIPLVREFDSTLVMLCGFGSGLGNGTCFALHARQR